MATIAADGLSKRFGPILAVDRLSFEVGGGTVLGFLGPNGAGKTTTLRMLVGLVEPTGGTATINGRRYRELADPLRHVGSVLEAAGFYPGRTARNHLKVQAVAGGLPARRVDEVLELVGLSDAADRRVGGYSLGMRQRLGVAAALLGDPEVLILDEPTNGLDPEGVRWIRELLRGFAQDGRTVVVSSHILAELAQTVDSVCILDRGHLVAQASLEELTRGVGRVVRIRTPRAEDLRVALAARGEAVRSVAPDRLEIANGSSEAVGTLAASLGIPVFEISEETPSLEEAFFRLTGAAPPGEAAR
jgi:ABC-2 type transport system ATP-binding protein